MDDKSLVLKNSFFKEVNEKARGSKLQGFTLDTDPIKTELAQVTAVVNEYKKSLNSGAVPDAMKVYEEFQQKLVTAGDDKIVAEIQRQIDEWRANQNNQ